MLRTRDNKIMMEACEFPEADFVTVVKYINKLAKKHFGKDVEPCDLNEVLPVFKASFAGATYIEYSWEFSETGKLKYKKFMDNFDYGISESSAYTPLIEILYQPGNKGLTVWFPKVTEYGSYDVDVDDVCNTKTVIKNVFHVNGDSFGAADIAKWVNKQDKTLDEHIEKSFINIKAANKLIGELEKRKDELVSLQNRWNEIDEEISELEDSKTELTSALETKLRGWVKLIKEQQDATK